MKKQPLTKLGLAIISSLFITSVYATELTEAEVNRTIDKIMQPILTEHNIPGMAIAVTIQGKRYFYNYGLASKESGEKVTKETIFEVGSVSKTFAATLASYAEATGSLSLNDSASKYLPALAGGHFDNISVLNLGTYTAGGLPLQFPDNIDNLQQTIDYFKNWQPKYQAGTYRQYSNPSLGLFGFLAAKSMNGDYVNLVEENIIKKIGLENTFFSVPQEKMKQYAYGYSKQDKPIRVNPGVLDSEAYGIKSSSEDMIKYVEANINSAKSSGNLQQAITNTRIGYFKVGEMTQGLGWEFYSYPVELKQLQEGNSSSVSYEANKVIKLTPPQPPKDNVFINKTGSTNGFGAYVAFVPGKQIGIVILANRNYPNPVRIEAAYRILAALE